MTTRVVLFNAGPDAVKVETQGRDAEGRFTAAAEDVLQPGAGGEFYLHGAQTLQLIEVSAGCSGAPTKPAAKRGAKPAAKAAAKPAGARTKKRAV